MSDETRRDETVVPAIDHDRPEPTASDAQVEMTSTEGSEGSALLEKPQEVGSEVESAQVVAAPAVETPAVEEVSAEDAPTAATEVRDTEPDDPEAAAAAAATAAVAEKARQARVAPLYRAFRAGRALSGKIERTIKGGYEIRMGRARAFCPHSQIDAKRVDDPESFVGRTEQFRITQLRRGGDDVVVSRRVLIEAEQHEEAAAVRATLIEGALMLGRVSGLAKFGAFVDLGAGVNGLVHMTELSHNRIQRVEQAVKVGEAVRVKILKLEGDGQRISLSIRQASEDPWATVTATYVSGQSYKGTVLRLAEFGAFVELAPGVEALAPAGEFAPTRGGWREGLDAGTEHAWRVLKVEAGRRRIALTLDVGEQGKPFPELAPGVELTGKVQRVERFGVFVWLGPGHVGLMPNVLSGTPPGTDLERRFPIADEVEVEIVEIDENGRIRLAKKGAQAEIAERRAARPPRERGRRAPASKRIPDGPPVSDSSVGFGSQLADKLKDALG